MWYERLGFDDNPFDDEKTSNLVGYDGVVEDVLYGIEAGNILFIEAASGAGKSALLRVAINQFKGEGKVAYIDCRKVGEVNIEEVILKKYGFFSRLKSKIPKGMIVLIDDVQSLSQKNCERVKYFYDQDYIRSIVFTGESFSKVNFTPSLKDRVSKVITLNGLSDGDAVDIVRQRLGKQAEVVSQDIIKEIFQRSNKLPKPFLENVQHLIEHAVMNNPEMKVQHKDMEHLFKKVGTRLGHQPVKTLAKKPKVTPKKAEKKRSKKQTRKRRVKKKKKRVPTAEQRRLKILKHKIREEERKLKRQLAVVERLKSKIEAKQNGDKAKQSVKEKAQEGTVRITPIKKKEEQPKVEVAYEDIAEKYY